MNKRTLLALGVVAAAGAVVWRRLSLRETLDWDDVPKPGRLIDIDGYRVHYVDQGAGPAIVLVHGFGGQTANYAQLMPLLAADHRVIAVDLKGYGYSERDARAGLSATDQVTMLRQLLDRLGVARAVFVGHSMGGGIVQRFAATYPDAVEALVLMASVSGEERLPGHLPPSGAAAPIPAAVREPRRHAPARWLLLRQDDPHAGDARGVRAASAHQGLARRPAGDGARRPPRRANRCRRDHDAGAAAVRRRGPRRAALGRRAHPRSASRTRASSSSTARRTCSSSSGRRSAPTRSPRSCGMRSRRRLARRPVRARIGFLAGLRHPMLG